MIWLLLANLAAAVAAANLAVAVAVHVSCCGGRRKRALISAAARGALGNAALMPRVNEPNSRAGRSCGGQCGGQQCQGQQCQECKTVAGSSPAAPAFAAQTPGRQCRQCTPEEERQCLEMMAKQGGCKAASVKAASPAASTSPIVKLYRKFKRATESKKQGN
ncbi:hypothetical protein M3Y97_01060400 [Aphelenchoides bicaudatus]|nr:hypothetical protein M3Y97_01060400 [Aphelenchoides bicaudatus]